MLRDAQQPGGALEAGNRQTGSENLGHTGNSRKGEDLMVTGIDVQLYNVQDFNRALAFYTAFFGREPAQLHRIGDGGWAEFELPDGSCFAIGKHENFPWQAGYNIMFAVPDVEEAVRFVRSHGCIASDPSESPVCWMSFAQDPDGNHLVLHRRK